MTYVTIGTDRTTYAIVSHLPLSHCFCPSCPGQLMVPDDARQFFAMALTKLGYSPNSTNPDEIKAAYEELNKL